MYLHIYTYIYIYRDMKEQEDEIRLKRASTPQMVLRQIEGWVLLVQEQRRVRQLGRWKDGCLGKLICRICKSMRNGFLKRRIEDKISSKTAVAQKKSLAVHSKFGATVVNCDRGDAPLSEHSLLSRARI